MDYNKTDKLFEEVTKKCGISAQYLKGIDTPTLTAAKISLEQFKNKYIKKFINKESEE